VHPGRLRQKSLPTPAYAVRPSFVAGTKLEGCATSNCGTAFLQRHHWRNSNPAPPRGYVPYGEVYIRIPWPHIVAVDIEAE
jgi:hypothetical protein